MKALVIKLPVKKIAAFTAGSLLIFAAVFSLRFSGFAMTKLLPIYGVNTDKPYIALTFDCAWEDSDLAKISKILSENNIPATFFVTGEFAQNYPEQIKALFKSGHEIGNHSNHHPHVASLSAQELKKDALDCSEAIKNAIGEYPKLYRAPYGEYNNNMLSVLSGLSMPVIQWDCDSCDWKPGATISSIERNLSKNLQNGSILLFHVDAKPKCTAGALEAIIPKLKSSGYEFKRVSDIIYDKPYKTDNCGRITKTAK